MKTEEFTALVRAGRVDEARIVLETARRRVKFAPDTLTVGPSGLIRTRRGKEVECDQEGRWHIRASGSKTS